MRRGRASPAVETLPMNTHACRKPFEWRATMALHCMYASGHHPKGFDARKTLPAL